MIDDVLPDGQCLTFPFLDEFLPVVSFLTAFCFPIVLDSGVR